MTSAAGGARPQVHFELTDGSNVVRLLAPEGATPNIRRQPRGVGAERQAVKQTTWHGGRGNELFSRDTTRFYDSGALWSLVRDQLTPGPLMRPSHGYRSSARLWPGDRVTLTQAHYGFWFRPLYANQQRVAQRFTPSANFNADKVEIIVRKVGVVTDNLVVYLRDEVAGAPGNALVTASLAPSAADDILSAVVTLDWSGTQALTAGANYYLEVGDPVGQPDANNHWEVGSGSYSVVGAPPAFVSQKSISWVSDVYRLYFRVVDADPDSHQGRAHFFEYQRALYCATEPPPGAAGALYLNGDRGVCTGTQFQTQIVDTTKAWTTNEWLGCIALVVKGPLRGQWRQIIGNGATSLTMSAWSATPTAGAGGDEYVILGSDKWTLLTSGLSAVVKSVIVVNGIVYFAQGGSVALRRMREYNNAGAWTREFADDASGNKFDLLTVRLDDTGKVRIYAGDHGSNLVRVRYAEVAAWGTNLDFGTGPSNDHRTDVGTSEALLTNLLDYNNQLWALKEDGAWVVQHDPVKPTDLIAFPAPVPLRPARDERNGAAAAAWNTYLYFSFLDGLERLYGQQIDDIGPNRDAGLPSGRRGRIAGLLPFLGTMYAANDAGDEGQSAILATPSPGGTWHELYRAPSGRRIQSLFYQSVPGLPNRLWFAEGPDLNYLVMPDSTSNPLNDDDMLYAWESYLTTSWLDYDSPELDHFFDELRLFAEGLGVNLLGVGTHAVEFDYQTNTPDQDWTRLAANRFTTSPYQLISLSSNQTGRRIRFRLRLIQGDSLNQSIITLRAWDHRAVTMHEVLYDYVFTINLQDRLMLLAGKDSTEAAADVLAQLDSWKEDATPLTLNTVVAEFDGVRGHIDPLGLALGAWAADKHALAGQIVFKQI